MTSILRKSAAFTAHTKPTVGDTKTSFVTDDHLGWLRCDGRQMSKADFGILFGVIGYTFGGSGNNFNLPDARGRVVGHDGSNNTLPFTPYVTGDLSGQDQIVLTVPQLPAHDHTGLTGISGEHTHVLNSANDDFNNNSGAYPVGSNPSFAAYDSGSRNWTSTVQSAGSHQHTIASQGNGVPISVMQPTIFMGNLFIYSGIPPYGVWPYTTGTNIY